MSRSRLAGVLLVATCVAGLGYRFLADSPRPTVRSPLPVCVCERELHLRDCDPYAALIIPVPLRNGGSEPLVLDQLRSDCSCQTVELRRRNETTVRATGVVTIAPDESVELLLALTPRGVSGLPPFTSLAFRTNDPEAPSVTVSVRIGCKPALLADPPILVFGTVHIGETEVRSARLSPSAESMAPLAVRIDDPRFTATLRPDGPGHILEVRGRSDSPGQFDSGVEIVNAEGGKTATRLALKGRFAEPVELSADTLYLPRGSSKGLVYEGVVTCTAPAGEVTIRAPAVPGGFTVTAADGRIEIRLDRPEDLNAEARVTIPVEITAGSKTLTRTVTVVATPPRTDR